MARGDATYGNTNVDWPFDPRCVALKSDSCRWLNHVLWLTAVKERREVLPIQYNFRFFAAMLGKKSANIEKWVTDMVSQRLVEILPDGRLKICGVRACHKKLKWKDAPYGDDTGETQQQEREESREKRVESTEHGDAANNSISDIPPKNILIDPSSPQYQAYNPDLKGPPLTLSEICTDLENFSRFEVYATNWTLFANMVNQGLNIDVLKKAVGHHIQDFQSTDRRPRFKRDNSDRPSIERRAERPPQARKSSDRGNDDDDPDQIKNIELFE